MEEARQVAAQGHDIVHMEVGQPGTPAPAAATEHVAEAMRRGDPMGYTVALGLPELREGIAQLYRDRHGIDLDPARVVITTGSSCGFILAFLAVFDAGNRVALADPGYPAYRNILGALDLEVVRIETGLSSGYQPTPDLLANAGPLDGLLIASPANPTGTMLDRASLENLVNFCSETGAVMISDEIYHGLSYGAREVSALQISDDVIVINSFAKYFSMTGWRIGWMVVPPDLVRTIENLAQNLFICPPHVSQVAALGALDATEELEAPMPPTELYCWRRFRNWGSVISHLRMVLSTFMRISRSWRTIAGRSANVCCMKQGWLRHRDWILTRSVATRPCVFRLRGPRQRLPMACGAFKSCSADGWPD